MQTAFLFDLDGVIIDSETQYSEFWKRVGERDFPHLPTFSSDIKGCTLTQIIDRYYAGDEARTRRVVRELDEFESRMTYPLTAGALEFVDDLRAKGWKTAVVTSSNAKKMACLHRVHPTLGTHFDRVFTSEDAQRSKPAPDCYVNAARCLGFAPEACYVVEDSLNGVRAGHDSGAHTIGITTTNPADALRPYCEHVVDGYEELRNIVLQTQ